MTTAALSVVKTVAAPIKAVIIEYVGYMRNYDTNMQKVQKELENLCAQKLDVDDAVKDGKGKGEKIKRETVNWLKNVEMLTQMEELKTLMKDDSVAQITVKLMERRVLKTLLKKDKDILDKVMIMVKDYNKVVLDKVEKMVEVSSNRLEDGVNDSHRNNKVALDNDDYKRVGEVVGEVIAETMEEFKKLMKEDITTAVVAMDLMEDKDLESLIKGDKEMAEIVRRVEAIREKEVGMCDHDEEQELPTQKPGDEVKPADTIKETVKSKAKYLGGLVMDQSFLKGLPEDVRYGLEVMDALCQGNPKSHEDPSRRHRFCGCPNWCANKFRGLRRQHDWSVAAEIISKAIEPLVTKPPEKPVTRPKRADELEDIQSGFLKDLQSREDVLKTVLKDLKDDKVNVVGVYGMGGSGKTTLAKEVANRGKAERMFDKTIMVEISKAADIERIQDQIAAEFRLSLDDTHNIRFRAKQLYNMMKPDNSQENKDAKKKTTLLVILDNIWEKLDLNDVGIPCDQYCKLLITSREKHVCEEMDVQGRNIFQVGVLDEKEARDLFWNQVGKTVDTGEYSSLADRLLNTCGGLPLSITTTANALKGKDLPKWQKFAEELEKPVSAQNSGVHDKTYMIIKSSYDFMENEEKKQFFLLACLSPIGSSISVETLMRYGIGLGLLHKVNKLSEAQKLADTWVEELVSSSMLLKGNSIEVEEEKYIPLSEGLSIRKVKIHDVVRASAISFAAKDSEHKFLVEVIPRWMKKEAFNDYTAISLLSQSFHHFPIRRAVQADKLRILLFKGSPQTKFPPRCFKGMENLEVLTLKSIVVDTELSDSIGTLTKLRTLNLEGCDLIDIRAIGLLVDLLVLSLRKSSLEELPNEIGELSNLILLDLTGTQCNVSANIIHRLSELEGLYMFDSSMMHPAVETEFFEEVGTSDGEVIVEADFDQVGTNDGEVIVEADFDRVGTSDGELIVEVEADFDQVGTTDGEAIVEADFDQVGISDGEAIVEADFDEEGTSDGEVIVEANSDQVGISDGEAIVEADLGQVRTSDGAGRSIEFNSLPYLNALEMTIPTPKDLPSDAQFISNLDNFRLCVGLVKNSFEGDFVGQKRKMSFDRLLDINNIYDIGGVLARSCLPALVKRADWLSLKGTNLEHLVPGLDEEGFKELRCLHVIVSRVKFIVNTYKILDDNLIAFPKLEFLGLEWLPNLKMVCDKAPSTTFFNLTCIYLRHLRSLQFVMPLALISRNVTEITVIDCKSLKYIFVENSNEETDVFELPSLKSLILTNLTSLSGFWGSKSASQEGRIWSHSDSQERQIFFNRKVKFPSLERLKMDNCSKASKIWSKELGFSGFRHLKELLLMNFEKLSSVGPLSAFAALDQLESLSIFDCENIVEVITEENDICDKPIRFSHLEQLYLSVLAKLVKFCGESYKLEFPMLKYVDFNMCGSMSSFTGLESSSVLFHDKITFPSLEILDLSSCSKVVKIWSKELGFSGFQHLKEIRLSEIEQLSSVGPASVFNALEQLELLDIDDCKNMVEVITGEDEEPHQHIRFPQLKSLSLCGLSKLVKFSRESYKLEFPKLRHLKMYELDNLSSFTGMESPSGLFDEKIDFPCLEELVAEEVNGHDAMEWYRGNPKYQPLFQ